MIDRKYLDKILESIQTEIGVVVVPSQCATVGGVIGDRLRWLRKYPEKIKKCSTSIFGGSRTPEKIKSCKDKLLKKKKDAESWLRKVIPQHQKYCK